MNQSNSMDIYSQKYVYPTPLPNNEVTKNVIKESRKSKSCSSKSSYQSDDSSCCFQSNEDYLNATSKKTSSKSNSSRSVKEGNF
jgi:hypothetical protein